MLPVALDEHGIDHSATSTKRGNIRGIFGKGRSGTHLFSSCSAFPEYFHRMIDYQQMDLDSAFYQMVTLCINPSKVYKSSYYRKQTKNRWARDDPGFSVIQIIFLLFASIAWGVAFKSSGISTYLKLMVHAVLIEWLLFGLIISTASWWLANKCLRIQTSDGIGDTFFVEQEVEWQYAFDIHCNSFFVLFLIVYIFQFLLIPLFLSGSFFALFFGNALYALACGVYFYITFLGYMALPFLHKTERFLYPLVVIILLFSASIMLRILFSTNINIAMISASYYFG